MKRVEAVIIISARGSGRGRHDGCIGLAAPPSQPGHGLNGRAGRGVSPIARHPSSRLLVHDWSTHTGKEQAVHMPVAPRPPRQTQVALASHVQPGDRLVNTGGDVEVVRVRRAQGRKPSRGENLHLVSDDDAIIKINSLDGIRIRPRL
jgi:hypothetical protein